MVVIFLLQLALQIIHFAAEVHLAPEIPTLGWVLNHYRDLRSTHDSIVPYLA